MSTASQHRAFRGRWSRRVLASVAAWAAGSVHGSSSPQAPDFSTDALAYRKSHSLESAPADRTGLVQALDTGYATLDVGAFELRYPWADLFDARRFEECQKIVLALIDLQDQWLEWIGATADVRDSATLDASLQACRKWVGTWKAATLKKRVDEHGRAAGLQLAGKEAAPAALAEWTAALRSGAIVGLELEPAPTTLVLAPTRPEFNGLCAYAGSLDPEWRGLLWTPILKSRVEFHLDRVVVLALEHGVPGDDSRGTSMNDREKSGLLQQVSQYSAMRLVDHYCGKQLDPGLRAGIAVGLVIDLLGENNSHVFGSTEGSSTPPREKFVRGGRDGGKLPKISADSRWRQQRGSDYFVSVLHDSQKEASKVAVKEHKEPAGAAAHFLIDSKDVSGDLELVSAPFLGEHAAARAVPENFMADYQEFLRAYRSAFVHWLKSDFEAESDTSRADRFARILRASSGSAAVPAESLFAEVYGIPMTSKDPKKPALEWLFLEWLARQK